jgi:signal transduction histidine kinase
MRIGFGVLFALLMAVSLIGVGRLFQIRVDYEDETARLFQLELEGERMRSAFVLEQAAVVRFRDPSRAQLDRAADEFRAASDHAAERIAGDTELATRLEGWLASEQAWRQAVAEPLLRGVTPPEAAQGRRIAAAAAAGRALGDGAQAAREDARTDARADTRDTTIVIAAGLGGALVAALLLFSGLINSMRAPLARLVEGAGRLAGGELHTRVEVGGPVEIATLGRAFNDMATALERDARERDRVERMKDDFVLTVSHELRTPVTVVKGFAEMLTAEKQNLAPQNAEAAEVIAESATQLQNMITDLLDLARSDAGKLRIDPEPTPVRSLAQRVGRQMRPNFEEKHQRLAVRVEAGLPPVMADPNRIAQVLSNLLTNACKYSPEGATVRLTATNHGAGVEFAVADDGPGLDADELDRVFERFWRAQSGETQSVGGTGLGLAIAKSLVELHGGEIGATSTPGRGATFHFSLPVAEDGGQARSEDGAQAAANAGAQAGRAKATAGGRSR